MAKRLPLQIRGPRKQPSGRDGAQADAFVSGDGGGAKGQKGIVQRADGRVTRRMTMYVDPDLAKRVQLYCLQNGREISEVAAEALERFIK